MPTTNGHAATKLILKPDGTVEVPLKGRAAVTLREPTMRELARIYRLMADADAALPQMPKMNAVTDETTVAEGARAMEELQRVAKERKAKIYGDPEDGMPPHAHAFIEVVIMLSDEETPPTPDEFYGWAMSTGACEMILSHFTAPLGGEG